jgi:septum site-determining protein MinC
MVALLRGRRHGLEIALAGRDFEQAFEELQACFLRQPGFYRGTSAVADFGAYVPTCDQIDRLQTLLFDAGIALRGLSGVAELASLADDYGLSFAASAAPDGGELERRRAFHAPRPALSDAARSLVADFAGARADIASRRKRGEASVRRTEAAGAESPLLRVVEAPAATLYHAGTLRGGQSLHHSGHIVVVGDVNPGAELIAGGDVAVFGRLAGVAHAGAQGDATARVYAFDLAPTQLRIAAFIAAEGEPPRRSPKPRGAESALVRDGRIAVLPLERAAKIPRQGDRS